MRFGLICAALSMLCCGLFTFVGCSRNQNASTLDTDRAAAYLATARLQKTAKYLDLLKNGDTNTVMAALVTDLDSEIIRVSDKAVMDKRISDSLSGVLVYRRNNPWLKRYMTAGDDIHGVADKIMNTP